MRKSSASEARRGARGGLLFLRRAARRTPPETCRPRPCVASSTREARHPAACPADRDAKTPGNNPLGREPPEEKNITASRDARENVGVVCVFFALSRSRVVVAAAADPSTRPSPPFRLAARSLR